MLLVTRKGKGHLRKGKGHLAKNSLAARFETLGPIHERVVLKDGVLVGRFFYRVGFGYIPPSSRAGERQSNLSARWISHYPK